MRKFLIMCMALVAYFIPSGLSAQSPTEMQYSILVYDGNGQLKVNKQVDIRLELRKGSSGGEVVWSKDYDVETDATGACLIYIDFGNDVDLSSGSFYLASIVDGEECGAPKLTSVPYAMQAAKVDGMVNRKELIGTSVCVAEDRLDGTFICSYTFNEDGTGDYTRMSGDGKDVYKNMIINDWEIIGHHLKLHYYAADINWEKDIITHILKDKNNQLWIADNLDEALRKFTKQ